MYTILILAGDTDGNIGDRGLVYAMCSELRKCVPGIRIILTSGNPERDREFFQAELIRKGIRGISALIKSAWKSDLVLCGGGGLFQDDDSLIKMPYWAIRLLFVRLFCKRIIGYSLGVGPLNRKISRISARLAFACMEKISVRDSIAEKISEKFTSKKVHLTPDPALLLPTESQDVAEKFLRQHNIPLDGTCLIGAALRKLPHEKPKLIPHKYACKLHLSKAFDEEKNEKLTTLLAKVMDFIAFEHNVHIIFMPSYIVPHEGDRIICERVMEKMSSQSKTLILITDPTLYKAVTGKLNLVIGGRMHPAIFAAGENTPIVGLEYNQKFSGLFELLGLRENVIGIHDFVSDELENELVALVSKVLSNRESLSNKIQELADEIRGFNESILFGLKYHFYNKVTDNELN